MSFKSIFQKGQEISRISWPPMPVHTFLPCSLAIRDSTQGSSLGYASHFGFPRGASWH